MTYRPGEQRRGAIVYRVQDKHGRGPFAPGLSSLWVEPRDDHLNLAPFYETWPDIVFSKYAFYGCGCRTIEQLKRWFTRSEYQTLQQIGFQAISLAADAIERENNIQCIFSRKRALKKGTTPIHFYD